jgi:hypothetical protein
MSDELAGAQAKLVEALLERRVPDGFDATGSQATAAILARKRKKLAAHERNHQPTGWLNRLRSWWTSR